MSDIRRAISVRQPHAEAILRGLKKVEYRSQPTNIRERVYIYASLKAEDGGVWDDYGIARTELPRGVMVGTVEIVDCVRSRHRGYYEYKLARPKRLARRLRPTNQPQPRFWVPQF